VIWPLLPIAASGKRSCGWSYNRLGEAILVQDGKQAEQLVRVLFSKARQDNVRLLRRWVAPLHRNF